MDLTKLLNRLEAEAKQMVLGRPERIFTFRSPEDMLALVELSRSAVRLREERDHYRSRCLGESEPVRRRGVDFPCEKCGAQVGTKLDDRGFYRCFQCGYPGQ